MRLKRSILIVFGIAAACSDAAVPGATVYDDLAGAYCDMLTSCNVTSIIPYRPMVEADPEACRERVALSLRQRPDATSLEAALRARRVILRPEALDACLAGVVAACTNRHDQVQACREAFVGTVPLGGACSLSDACAGDSFCQPSATRGCPGTCAPRAARGEPCVYVDAQCSAVDGPSVCTGGRCAELETVWGGEGEPCFDPGFSDTWGWPLCAWGFTCVDDVCTRGVALGERCDAAPCAPGLICVPDADAHRCQQELVATEVGATCNPGDPTAPLVSCDVFAGLACVDGRCATVGDGRLGGACRREVDVVDDLFGTGDRCAPGATCDEASETCVELAPEGLDAPCGDDAECASGRCDGVCVPPECGP